MNIALFAYSRRGCETARAVSAALNDAQVRAFTLAKFEQSDFEVLEKPLYGTLFQQMDALIFISSCGIAVRQIAPFVKDKATDPAVLCIDELGKFVIPLLSGHIGGANALARQTAAQLGAVSVVTTATDINRKFSVDAWATRNGLCIDDLKKVKAVSAEILERDVPIACALPVRTPYPAGTFPGQSGPIGIAIGWGTDDPFGTTLHLIPPVLHLGIGCRKGTGKAQILDAVRQVLEEYRIDPRAIRCAASIDLKSEEAGLLEYCREAGIPIRFYSAEELLALEGEFSTSNFVKQIAGVDCVCERSAMMGADRLIVRKIACNGVTVAIAAERYEVSFG